MLLSNGVRGAQISPIINAQYGQVMKTFVSSAKMRCLVNIFILDALPRKDRKNQIYQLIQELQRAHLRGVDTRVIIGGSRYNLEIDEACFFSRDLCKYMGIPVMLLSDEEVRGSHAKVVIIDDQVVLGSHNWTPGAFTKQIQDSVCIQSAPLAEVQAEYFDKLWNGRVV